MPTPPRSALSPAAALRLMTRPGPETRGAAAEPDSVIVTPTVGSDVVVITGRFGNGRRPIEFRIDRSDFTDEEVASLIAWVRRTVHRKDSARQGRLRAV